MHVRSSAKLNLTLDITARRADGYHELDSLVHTVALWDELAFEFDVPWRFRCNIPQLENDANLCVQAAQKWFEVARENGAPLETSRGVGIWLQKNIPSGSGLGGGSGNAAAVLAALRQHYDREKRWINDAQMLQIAATLGADVPLFLRGGAVRMQGIGEKLSALPTLQAWTVIVRGPQGVSTPLAYRTWDDMNGDKPRTNLTTSTARLVQTWKTAAENGASTCGIEKVAKMLHNDLSACAQRLEIPVQEARAALLEAGALGAEMTGSGAAVFGLFATQNVAQQAAQQLQQARYARFNWRIWAAELCENAVEFGV